MSLTFVGFVQRKASDSQRPGSSTQNISINGIRKEHDATDPNAALFGVQTDGSINVQLSGLVEKASAQLNGGQRVKITIEPMDEPKAT